MSQSEIKPCPICGNHYLAIRTDVYKDKREFIYCDVCGSLATRPMWELATRDLKEIEQYQVQMAGISAAAAGHWTEGEAIHRDFDTVAIRDVSKLYAKYKEAKDLLTICESK